MECYGEVLDGATARKSTTSKIMEKRKLRNVLNTQRVLFFFLSACIHTLIARACFEGYRYCCLYGNLFMQLCENESEKLHSFSCLRVVITVESKEAK